MQLILLLKAVVMGLVEGATEFIPVSSTGHLILTQAVLDFNGATADTFSIFIQLGAILAVVWLYREKIYGVITASAKHPEGPVLIVNLAIAFAPAALVGFLTHDWIKSNLFNPLAVAWALLVGGMVILLIEKWDPAVTVEGADYMPWRKALGIGVAQVLSLFPGVSRSGATIMGARSLGLSRRAATEFSFFLAIPVMFAATGYDLIKSRNLLTAADAPVFAVGFAVSFVSALFVVKAFLAYVSQKSFVGFAWYRIIFGALLLIVFW
ncbi:MAG: undecaprenyl-diphosphate phosphatase [Gemmatimonadota bacterium]